MAALSAMRNDSFKMIHNLVPTRPDPEPDTVDMVDHPWSGLPGARILSTGTMKAEFDRLGIRWRSEHLRPRPKVSALARVVRTIGDGS